MSTTTSIEWTHHTFNPWRGCSKVHAGCTHCYAEKNVGVKLHGIRWGEVWQGGQRVIAADSAWTHPRTWARAAAKAGVRRRVFCASLADVLEVPEMPPFQHLTTENRERVNEARKAMDAARERLWSVIRATYFLCSNERSGRCRSPAPSMDAGECAGCGAPAGGLDWLLLTKRPENLHLVPEDVRPLVWPGTSVSDQQTADALVPRLLEAHGFRLRFLSVEPLVGRVDLTRYLKPTLHTNGGERLQHPDPRIPSEGGRWEWGVSWVIVGGESGRQARPCHVEWVRDVVRQCREAGVPCFVKQLGARPAPWSLKDPKGGDMSEWTEDLRVREFPEVSRA